MTLPQSGWRRWLLEGALVLALFAAFQFWQGRHLAQGPAPLFAGLRIDGSHFDLAEWRADHPGRATLLYVWAEWCPICRNTAGNVSSVATEWPVTSICIQSGENGQVAKLVRERGYPWPTLADPTATLPRQYGLPGVVPAFIVIDPAGKIRFSTVGQTSEIGLRLRLWWAENISP